MEYIKVVINTCYGGFGLSKKGFELYKQLTGNDRFSSRHDFALVKVVEDLGKDSYKKYAELTVERIPIEFKDCYLINEYDGLETIDLSSNLLIEHQLNQLDVANMDPTECKAILLEFQKISSTNYYERMSQ